MFDAIRNQKKFLMGVLLVLVIPAFVLVGVEGYTRYNEQSEAVATVNGEDITRQEWDAAHRVEMDRLRESMPGIDTRLLDSPEARYATLERLVRERVLAAAVEDLRLYTSDQKLARELSNNPTIASLRTPDGRLDVEAYRAILGRRGMTPDMFEASIRAELSQLQVLEGLGASAVLGTAQSNVALDAFFQRRSVRVLTLPAADFVAKAVPTEADLQAHYNTHSAAFRTPESADVQYVVLDLPTIEKGIVLNEADVRAYYEQNAARLAVGEERRASHILLALPAGVSAEDKAKIRTKADELLAQLRQEPARFAELARAHSEDPGSASNGGDLDFFARGAMVKPFEDAVFALPKGGISDVVESDFGLHIIQLTDIKAAAVPSFEAMRAELESELKRQQSQRRFAELVDQFNNLVYEKANSLQPVADALGLELRSVQGVGRTAVPPGHEELVPRVLDAVFSSESVMQQRNTEAIEIGSNRLVAARVVQHYPERTRPLSEVLADVRSRWVSERAAAMARDAGEALLQAARSGQAPAGLGNEVTVARDQPGSLAPQMLAAAMAAPVDTLPAWVGVAQGDQGYTVIQVTGVQERVPADPQRAEAERTQVRQWLAAAEMAAYYETLKQRFKVNILAPQPQR